MENDAQHRCFCNSILQGSARLVFFDLVNSDSSSCQFVSYFIDTCTGKGPFTHNT